MTATASCDHAGADAVVRGCQRGVIRGAELRLVVTAQIVSRVLSISGVDGLLSMYRSLEAATAAQPPAAVLALVADPAGAGSNGRPLPHRAGGQAARSRQPGQQTAAGQASPGGDTGTTSPPPGSPLSRPASAAPSPVAHVGSCQVEVAGARV